MNWVYLRPEDRDKAFMWPRTVLGWVLLAAWLGASFWLAMAVWGPG